MINSLSPKAFLMRETAVASFLTVTAVTAVLSGCSDCKPTLHAERTSPDGRLVATAYAYECGAMSPFSFRVGIRKATETTSHEVVTILEAAFEANPEWQSPNTLVITFECPSDPIAACQPPSDRNWVLRTSPDWNDVHIRYVIGPRLKSKLSPQQFERFPK